MPGANVAAFAHQQRLQVRQVSPLRRPRSMDERDGRVSARSAIPAIEAYRVDHRTYVGVTLAKIRTYDSSARVVAVKRAGTNDYCIQSTLPGPVVHFAGPTGPVRRDRCGVRGPVVPRPAPAITESLLRGAIPAIEAYAAENGG
jgi:hypothetical protein